MAFPAGWDSAEPSLPIQLKRRLEEAVAIADRPGFTVHVQVCCTFPHQTTAQVGPIDMQFAQRGLLSALGLQRWPR